MRTLVAAAFVASARADETSLMQDLVKRSASNKLSADATRQDSTSKLLDTAVNMIKNGVTPDVITFVDATTQDINEEVLIAIQSEHDIDQAYINSLCQDFMNAVQALEDQAASIAVNKEKLMALVQSQQGDDDDDLDMGAPAAKVYESKGGSIVDVLADMKDKAEGGLSDLRRLSQTPHTTSIC